MRVILCLFLLLSAVSVAHEGVPIHMDDVMDVDHGTRISLRRSARCLRAELPARAVSTFCQYAGTHAAPIPLSHMAATSRRCWHL